MCRLRILRRANARSALGASRHCSGAASSSTDATASCPPQICLVDSGDTVGAMDGAEWLGDLAYQLGAVAGVVGVMLGGSRARGDQSPTSDYDLGIYYQPPLDTDALLSLAREASGSDAVVSQPGDWGPWVDGGAWLRMSDAPVDWIYRNIDRVEATWEEARNGRFEFHMQTGHPLGVPDFAYAGEVALGIVLHDPSGRLGTLQREAKQYPPALAGALLNRLWEADFLLGGLRKSLQRADSVWVAGCLFRVVMLCVHALHGRAGRWLINEKGAMAAIERFAEAPPGFTEHAQALLAHPGESVAELARTLESAETLVSMTRAACQTAR